jgi:RNA polymerase sigma-70 factor (ECF subfamily)
VSVESTAPASEEQLCAALRRGDEDAFAELLHGYGSPMMRLALSIVGSRAVAEEVLQETWLAVFERIGRFEGRSSLKTWLFTILTNRAKTHAARERRGRPFSALVDESADSAVAADRFLADGRWASVPRRWQDLPEERLASRETLAVIADAIAALPAPYRAVISLRDVEGWDADDVCAALDLNDGNQRVILHRARAKVRQALEDHFRP